MVRNSGKVPLHKAPGPGLKMQDLVAATGVPKSTILHYLNEGLLPEPVKTSRNMAYYSPACVERLTFIKVMQSKYRLSLALIKKFLQEGKVGPEIEPLLELRSFIFGRQDDRELLDLAAFCKATGLTAREVAELTARGLLLPLEPERFDAEDLTIGRVLKRCRELGISPGGGLFLPPPGPGDGGPRNGPAGSADQRALPGRQRHPDPGADQGGQGPASLYY